MLHKLKLLGYPLKLFLTGKSEAVAFCPKSFFLIFIIVAEDFCVFFFRFSKSQNLFTPTFNFSRV